MAELPKLKEIELSIDGRKERLRYEISPGGQDKAPFVMLIPGDGEQRTRLSLRGEAMRRLEEQVAEKTGLQHPIVAVQGPGIHRPKIISIR